MSTNKGIVLESKDGWSTILMEGGQCKRVRQSLETGEVYCESPTRITTYGKYAVAAVLVLILLGAADFFNVVAYANVSTGVNMGVNRWNRVVSVNYTDDTGTAAPAKDLDLKGQKIEDAVAMVVQETAQKQDPAAVKIEVTSKNGNNLPLEENIMGKVETSIGNMSRSNNGKASYQRQGKVIEIEDLEKLVPKSSTGKSNSKNSDNNGPSRSDQDNAANNNKNQDRSPVNQYKDNSPKGQIEQPNETHPEQGRGALNKETPAPAANKKANASREEDKGIGKVKDKNNKDNNGSPPGKTSGQGNNKN